ncbi:hypothetical protein K443DRAFT_684586 [Laccaria amethystina LaAM-08-1]|uniref:Uncharacterized protein n=1 Tax=Laccaria amethystina LaAM-08-1 TaxID=1095629 RepID=A0A0C9WIR1_9AGAR|nr:hypothetical protein K443DRAFT_684586 [Laccaria amethystina LaAM-08-1]
MLTPTDNFNVVQALRTHSGIATLHSKLRLGIHSAPTELCSRHTLTRNAPAHTTSTYTRSIARIEDTLQTPSPRNLPPLVWTKGNLSARRYNAPRARPAFSNFCERLLLMNRVWKQQRDIKGVRDTLQGENEAVEGGCCYAGSEADGVGCPEGEAFRGSWGGQVGCWKDGGSA